MRVRMNSLSQSPYLKKEGKIKTRKRDIFYQNCFEFKIICIVAQYDDFQ